jgi:hypothetical protein
MRYLVAFLMVAFIGSIALAGIQLGPMPESSVKIDPSYDSDSDAPPFGHTQASFTISAASPVQSDNDYTIVQATLYEGTTNRASMALNSKDEETFDYRTLSVTPSTTYEGRLNRQVVGEEATNYNGNIELKVTWQEQ